MLPARRPRRPLARPRPPPHGGPRRPRRTCRASLADLRAAFRAPAGQTVDQRGLKARLAPHLREDLRRHRRAQRADPRRRRHRAPRPASSPSPTPASPSSPRSGRSASPAAASPLIELAKALGLAALTALLALPLGLALAWVLTAVVNVRAFGWRLPVLLFPGQWATLFALALVTAALAAALARPPPPPRLPPRLLQGFSNER